MCEHHRQTNISNKRYSVDCITKKNDLHNNSDDCNKDCDKLLLLWLSWPLLLGFFVCFATVVADVAAVVDAVAADVIAVVVIVGVVVCC